MMGTEDPLPPAGTDLLVRMVVPIRSQPIVGVGGVIFHQWLPMSDEDRIVVEGNGLELALWFDRSSLDYPKGEDPLRCANVSAHRLIVEARIHDLGEDFLDFILAVSNEPKPEGYPHSDRYMELGEKLYSFSMNCINRLITFARVEKGQYWLEEFEVNLDRMASAYISFRSVCSRDGVRWYNWRPTSSERVTVVMTKESSWIERDDWSRAAGYLSGKGRSNFVFDLLMSALANAWGGRRRTALVDAVTALEVAISDFAKSHLSDRAFGPTLADRMDVRSLKSQVEHMGTSGTIRYLFPVIFPEEVVSGDLLNTCQGAVAERNNVVHNGQRDVEEKRVLKHITSIERLCRILRHLMESEPPLEGLERP